jgi:pSer/pThr/pTyr-binding forkhead associated (FHA) protein
MADADTIPAWLDSSSGGRFPLQGACSIGRLSSNSIMLADERVSRRHSLINSQGDHEFWLVDLGSGNGTYLNGRRVVQPTRLRDGDKIEIAAFSLIFRQNAAAAPPAPAHDPAEKTIQQIKPVDCWLLVADIEDSTQLMHKLSEGNLPVVTGRWIEDCKRLIEQHGGSVNKFLGDGFLAYWRDEAAAPENVARTLETLARMQTTSALAFRVVLHFGQVFTGGAASLGEESLQGKEVHFVFRMEKLAGSKGERCLISHGAKLHLPSRLNLADAGRHPLPGFDGEHAFYSLTPAPR